MNAAGAARAGGRVAVVGGGWAGCAAAVTLADAGFAVTVFEQADTLGGRARRVPRDGLVLDNGQHLLVGAYATTLELVARVHGPASLRRLLHRMPLTLRPFGRPRGAVDLEASRLPAPWHLATAMLGARGLGVGERLAVVAAFRRLHRNGFHCPLDQSVARWFDGAPPRTLAGVWTPLCLAALNTPPETASAQIYANVLRAAFAGPRHCSDFLVPRVDLSALFPDAAARFVVDRGGTIRTAVRARVAARADGAPRIETADGAETFAAAVVATGPHQLAAALNEELHSGSPWQAVLALTTAFRYESITTVYLGLAGPIAIDAPVMRLDDAPGQWLFDRTDALPAAPSAAMRSLVAVVISASGPHDALAHADLARAVAMQLRALDPRLPEVVWSRVIAERRATYSCTPALARPAAGRVAPGLYLAGDYTDREFPATLEAATRSGCAAASAVIADMAAPSPSRAAGGIDAQSADRFARPMLKAS